MTTSEIEPDLTFEEDLSEFRPKPNPFVDKALFSIDDGIDVSISWDKVYDELVFEVEMPSDAYLAFGFGAQMEECDMLVFSTELGGEDKATDCYFSQETGEYQARFGKEYVDR